MIIGKLTIYGISIFIAGLVIGSGVSSFVLEKESIIQKQEQAPTGADALFLEQGKGVIDGVFAYGRGTVVQVDSTHVVVEKNAKQIDALFDAGTRVEIVPKDPAAGEGAQRPKQGTIQDIKLKDEIFVSVAVQKDGILMVRSITITR